MPIKIPNLLPATQTLHEENVEAEQEEYRLAEGEQHLIDRGHR